MPRIRPPDIRPLRESRPFRDLWIGTSASQLGSQIAALATLAHVWDLTSSPLATGAIGLATAVPTVATAMLGGTLADTLDRRTLARASAAGQLLVAATLYAWAASDVRGVAPLFVLSAAGSACAALGAPARRALPARLLPADRVAAGLALTHASFQSAILVGPPLAGLVIAHAGFAGAHALHAGTAAISLFSTTRLPSLRPEPLPTGARRGRWAAGRLILRRPALRGCLATDAAATLMAMPISLFPLVNEARFGGDPRTLGLFLSALAAGGVTAGLLSGTVTRSRRAGAAQLAAAGAWCLALAGFALAEPLWAALGFLALAGAADTVSVVARAAVIQSETPDAYRGRVGAVEHVVGVAGPELGNFRGGLLASATSAPVALVLGSVSAALVITVVAVRNAPLRGHRLPATGP
ncbi:MULTISPECIES: MFS transporter [unclassified Streptomyces]|uniref:MFS transporter n=1 Tax=unclassified Streptomyces TaxID=2593676 RepID=UPI001F5B2849|nr:MFS transporter [Streptomyces sp. HSG2]